MRRKKERFITGRWGLGRGDVTEKAHHDPRPGKCYAECMSRVDDVNYCYNLCFGWREYTLPTFQ